MFHRKAFWFPLRPIRLFNLTMLCRFVQSKRDTLTYSISTIASIQKTLYRALHALDFLFSSACSSHFNSTPFFIYEIEMIQQLNGYVYTHFRHACESAMRDQCLFGITSLWSKNWVFQAWHALSCEYTSRRQPRHLIWLNCRVHWVFYLFILANTVWMRNH